jgi:hypothetical protein
MAHERDRLRRAQLSATADTASQRAKKKRATQAVSIDPFGPLDRDSLLQLQRTAGNLAVSEHLSGQVVQRYEAGEHVQFGDLTDKPKDKYLVSGVWLTYGQMIAMGDFFETPQEMKAAPRKVIEKLRDLIDKDKSDPGKAVTNQEWQDATMDLPAGHRYLDMAAKNAAHFAPGPAVTPKGEPPADHYEAWKTFHFQALDLAREGKRSEAMETNAFADHFLTDAFSAGHLFNKADVAAKSKKSFEALPLEGRYGMRTNDFTDRVGAAIMADPKAAVLKDYEIDVGRAMDDWQEVTAHNLSQIVSAVSWKKEGYFYSLFVRILHDRLNRDITHRYGGLEVENNIGDKWRLSGDETLKYSEDTLEIGRRAVAQSQANVTSVIGSKDKPNYEALAKKVWDFTPHPTEAGKKKIDTFEGQLTDASQEATAKEFAAVVVDNFDTLIDQLVHEEKRLRKKTPVKK